MGRTETEQKNEVNHLRFIDIYNLLNTFFATIQRQVVVLSSYVLRLLTEINNLNKRVCSCHAYTYSKSFQHAIQFLLKS